MIALQVHGDLGWAEVIVLPQVEDLAHYFGLGRVGANKRPTRPLAQAVQPQLFIAAPPVVIGVA